MGIGFLLITPNLTIFIFFTFFTFFSIRLKNLNLKMRLIATFAAVATVNATFFEDTNDVLSRSRRVAADDDDQCAEGEVMSQDGFCFDSVEEMLDIMGPLEDDDSLSAKRKFPIGSSVPEDDDSSNDASERTKRRSQRVTLLMSKVASDGNLMDVLNPGKK